MVDSSGLQFTYGAMQQATLASGMTNGYLITTPIIPGSMSSWTSLSFIKQNPGASQLHASLMDCTDDSLITGYTDMLMGSLPISIASLSKTTYSCIKVKIDFSRPSVTDPKPTLSKLTANWVAYPLYLISTQTSATKAASDSISVVVKRSNNYVTDTDIVVYAPLPSISNG